MFDVDIDNYSTTHTISDIDPQVNIECETDTLRTSMVCYTLVLENSMLTC